MKKSLPNEWKAEMPEAQEDDLLHKALRQKFDEELKQKWAGQLAEQGVVRKPTAGEPRIMPMRKGRSKWWSAAAAILVLFGIAWWLFMQPSTPNSAQLADQYFVEIADQVAQIPKGEGDDSDWQKAQEFYAKDKFDEAIISMKAMAAAKPLNAGQYYFLAFCHLGAEPPAFDLAQADLDAARQASLSNKTDNHIAEIEWVSALISLKKGDHATAADQLRSIEQAGGWYAAKAKVLLKTIE